MLRPIVPGSSRLIYLREYWMKRLVDKYSDRFTLHTSRKPGLAYGIATVEMNDVPTGKLCGWLWKNHRIITTGINHETARGVRVSPKLMLPIHEEEG